MNTEQINKKRKKLNFVSLFFTVLIMAVYVVVIVIFSKYLLFVSLIGLVFVILFLYILSKFFVMKKYDLIKLDVMRVSILKDLKCEDVFLNNGKDLAMLHHFFDKKYLSIKGNFLFKNKEDWIKVIEFETQEKRFFQSNKVNKAGKYISLSLNNAKQDCIFILANMDETEKFVNYYSYFYKKRNNHVVSLQNKSYICLYNDIIDMEVLNKFEKTNEFHCIYLHDTICEIIYLDKNPIFDFKLQKEINNNTYASCKTCFSKCIKILNSIRKGK